MSILATCPCGKRFAAKEELAGKVVKCPQCGQAFRVPWGGPQPTMPASASPSPAFQPANLGTALGGGRQSGPGEFAGGKKQRANLIPWVVLGGGAVVALLLAGALLTVLLPGDSDNTATLEAVTEAGDAVSSTPVSSAPPTPARRRRRRRPVSNSRGPASPPAARPTPPPATVVDAPPPTADEPAAWSVKSAPVTVQRSEVTRLPLIPRSRVKRLLFSSPEVGQALLRATTDGEDMLFRIDLATGDALSRTSIPASKRIHALSSDGQWLLVQDQFESRAHLEVFRWTRDGVERAGHVDLDHSPTNRLDIRFVDHERLLVYSYVTQAISLWHIPSGKKQFSVPAQGQMLVTLSPGREYFAMRVAKQSLVEPAKLSIRKTSDGRQAGLLSVPAVNQVNIQTFGFKPDGRMLAAVAEEGFQSNTRTLYCWDLTTGGLVAEIPLAAARMDPLREGIVWFNDRFLGVFDGNVSATLALVDLELQDHVWDYVVSRTARREAEQVGLDPSGRIWLYQEGAVRDGRQRPAALVPYELPRAAEIAKIEAVYSENAVFASGGAVALEVSLATTPHQKLSGIARQLIEETRGVLRKELARNDMRVSEDAPVRFQAVVSHETTGEQLRVPVHYMKGGVIKDTRYAQIPNQIVTVTLTLLDESGTPRWSRRQSFQSNAVAPCEELPNAMLRTEYRLAAELYPWVQTRRWVRTLSLPREFSEQRAGPLGSTPLP